MTDLPRFVVDGMARQEALQDRVEAVLAEHLPQPSEGQDSNEDEAFMLLVTWADRTGGYRVASKAPETARLDDLQHAANALAAAYKALSPLSRRALEAEAGRQDGMTLDTYLTTAALAPLGQIAALPERIRKARPAADRAIAKAADERRTNWRAVSLVDDCRDLWKRRTGRAAPARALDPSAPFGRFLCDVLAAFDAGQPRPAFNAWARLHS